MIDLNRLNPNYTWTWLYINPLGDPSQSFLNPSIYVTHGWKRAGLSAPWLFLVDRTGSILAMRVPAVMEGPEKVTQLGPQRMRDQGFARGIFRAAARSNGGGFSMTPVWWASPHIFRSIWMMFLLCKIRVVTLGISSRVTICYNTSWSNRGQLRWDLPVGCLQSFPS